MRGAAMVTEGSIWLHGYQISTPVRHFVASNAQGHHYQYIKRLDSDTHAQ